MNDDVLLLFDTQYPCWTMTMFELADVSLDTVASLHEQELLNREGNIYFLTDSGRARFETLAQESWLPITPGVLNKGNYFCDIDAISNIEDLKRIAFACELKFLLDKRHLQRWGLKEYELPFVVTIPDLASEKIFRLDIDAQRVTWLWPKHPFFTTLRTADRDALDRIRAAFITNDHDLAVREVKFDLLYKSRYDFQMYAHFKPIPTDKYGLFNVDRFLFTAPPAGHQDDLNFYLTRIGEFQMFFDLVRHIYLPGFTDRDAFEQDCINWLLFAFTTDIEAQACADLLKPFQKAFDIPVTDATPTEIWTVSLEALKHYPDGSLSTLEMICDLLPFAAHPVFHLE